MRAKKSLGQHFLLHKRIAQRMVNVAKVTEKDNVIEIGPGTGKLTEAILEKAKKVIALETDENLVHFLEEKYVSYVQDKHLEIYHQDVRTFNLSTAPIPYILLANIPYYLTSAILRQFLETKYQPERAVLLVQKEVANRIAREKKESILSISVKVFGDPTYEFTVPRGAFLPIPSVDSAVLSIQNIHNPFATERANAIFFSILRAGFSHKRKKLENNLLILSDSNTIQNAFIYANITNGSRAEDVSIEKWHLLSKYLS